MQTLPRAYCTQVKVEKEPTRHMPGRAGKTTKNMGEEEVSTEEGEKDSL